jgi:hypothetical protein
VGGGIKRTYYGDANLNGEFNSSDLVDVFQLGQYEDGVAANSGWAAGDWNGDREFDSSDFVTAFQAGGYEQGPRGAVAASAIPEPGTGLLAGIALLVSSLARRIVGTAAARAGARGDVQRE